MGWVSWSNSDESLVVVPRHSVLEGLGIRIYLFSPVSLQFIEQGPGSRPTTVLVLFLYPRD